ncbi:chemotaxis protein CheX [Actinotalea fermentans]|uniref:Chemotaxis phosphatase CheX-like domain-containing protein n=1 Tax=Actinotalea fermentans TaxID=43671 RepID=A0A511YZQ0_9CELL|nr:chemotaxis protein CheX [Actinotalea fermentans]KGM15445.1 hypothetical protein N867_08355 [Actinotalea fermentans ATCC 43279 = JCM 9966 = DSM 3133]GEN80596.1 hypothetical protein AFE02nite_23300 [Actinotalea fermentans]
MSFEIDVQAFEGTDPVYDIASEVFAAMIDGEPGFVRPWEGAPPAPVDELFAWVDVTGPMNGRVLLSTETTTAVEVTRALLGLAPDEPVVHADIVDALGEVANVVGGNVKSLGPDHSVLTLPEVTKERPTTEGGLLHTLSLDWRGRLLVLSLWMLP